MKPRVLALSALVALVSFGCGQKDSSSGSASAAASNVQTVEITADDTMKYSLNAITATPGQDMKVILTNNGTQPAEVMAHNWVLLKPGTDVTAFDAAAISAKDTLYIPPALKDEIVAKIDMVGPKKSGEADFKAPMTPGDYPFLCTFPAHYQVGMKGVLTVK